MLSTYVAPDVLIAMYLSCLSSKKKSVTFFMACFILSCSMVEYRVEKREIETAEALFVLFSLLIASSDAS